MIFNHSNFSIINENSLVSNITSLLGSTDRLNFMDFGCGIASLYEKIPNKNFILFDKNKDVLRLHDNKKEHNICTIHSLDELLLNEIKPDIVLLNSVIQYIKKENLLEIINFFISNFPHIKLIISDIPVHNRFVEFLLLFVTNTKDIFTIYSDIFTNISNKDYKDLDFITYDKEFFQSIEGTNIEIKKNFYLFKTRYSILITKD